MKNILVKFHSTGYSRDQVGFWLTDREGYNTLLSLLDEYAASDYEKYPFVWNNVKYTPEGIRYNISIMTIDEETAKFMFPYCSVLGDNVLTMFISFMTFQKGVLMR